MKNRILTLTALIAALAALASPVRAGDRGDKIAAAVGGFIGGVIVGSHIDRGHPHPAPAYCPPPVVVHPEPCAPAGYWDTVSTRVWVPAGWVVTVDACGRRVRSHVAGHYEYRSERVWVEYRGGHRGPIPGRVVVSSPRRW